MNRILFISLLVMSSLFCFSQSLTINTLEDASLNYIPDVKLLVLDNNGSIITITSTDKKGSTAIDIPYGTYSIKASHLAYSKWNQKITFDRSNTILKIRMVQKIENLAEVEIHASGYIKKHGDTTTISLPKIINGKERNVIDVLKKIKGVKVLDDGTVVYNKKEVTDLLINGTKVFDNDYKSVLTKIKPHEMVKIQFIENYKDDTNSKILAKDAMAMNLGFKNNFFLSGNLEVGLGVSSGRSIDASILQNAKWITSFISINHQNIGLSESGKLLSTEFLNPNANSHYKPYTSLATLNAIGLEAIEATDFNDTFTYRFNTSVKLSKKTQLFIKSNTVQETLNRKNSTASIFTIDNNATLRNESTIQNVDYFNTENNIGILHKTKTSIFKSSVFFKNLNYEHHQNINLNGNSNLQVIKEHRQQFNVDIKYERLLNANTPIVINTGYHYKPFNQNLINDGFTTLKQHLSTNEHIYYANASLFKTLKDSSVISTRLKSNLSRISQNTNRESLSSSFFNDEQLMTNVLNFDWRKETKPKNWNLSSGINLYTFNLNNQRSYVKVAPFISADLTIKNKKTSHNYRVKSNTDWILNNPFTPFTIFQSFNNSYSFNATNDVMRTSQLSYRAARSNYLTDTSIGVSLLHNNKSTLSNFNINENNSNTSLNIINKDVYRLNFNAKYNTLLWKLFFLEFSINPSFGNSFIANTSGNINEVTNSIYTAEIKFNRRFTKQIFIGSTTQFQYREFKTDLNTNNVQNYNTNLYATWEFGDFELKGNYHHIKLGEDSKAANFSSLNISYTPKDSNFKAFVQLFNLFNIKNISTLNTSNIGEFSSSFNIPERRLISSISYTF